MWKVGRCIERTHLTSARTRWNAAAFLVGLCLSNAGWPQSLIVAASNSSSEEKSRADLICDGKDDQIELLASLLKAATFEVAVDTSPAHSMRVKCRGRFVVEWAAGDYFLGGTLEIPDAADFVIHAQGTFFHYLPSEGDAVVVRGMNRCRYDFGTIETKSNGSALRISPTHHMPALMSFVTFMGLIGSNQQGIGLHLDHREENVCVNQFTGTDIQGFDIGVLVDDAVTYQGGTRPSVKSDTNWYWFSYIRLCNTCIWEKAGGVDCGYWEVNVDASIPGSTAVRTAGKYSQWRIIMGTWDLDGSHALILDSGAEHQIIEMRPPLDVFRWRDDSGNGTNVFLSTSRLPYRKAPSAEIQSYWNRAGGVPGQHEARKQELEATARQMEGSSDEKN